MKVVWFLIVMHGKILNLAICYLEEQHRQEDDLLTEILNTIRNNEMGERHYDILKKNRE